MTCIHLLREKLEKNKNNPQFIEWYREFALFGFPNKYECSTGKTSTLYMGIRFRQEIPWIINAKSAKVTVICGVNLPDLKADIDESYR